MTVTFVSVLLDTIAPTVSLIVSARVVPFTVIASASSVPSISTLPEISSVAADNSPAIAILPLDGLYVSPVSVSAPCAPVAPSTNIG